MTHSTLDLYTLLLEFQAKRKFPNWEPTYPYTTNDIPLTKVKVEAKDSVIKRALAFINLEIQVQTWIKQVAQDSELKSIVFCLETNAKDELKHDEVLEYLSYYYGGSIVTEESQALVQEWQSLEVHPIVSAYCLEMGVFFSILPALNKYGDIYASQVGAWIADDERCHVETNLAIMKHLELKFDKSLAGLVYRTVRYIFGSLGETKANEEALRSVHRLVSGKDKQMLTESIPFTPAFFEQDDKRSIQY